MYTLPECVHNLALETNEYAIGDRNSLALGGDFCYHRHHALRSYEHTSAAFGTPGSKLPRCSSLALVVQW